MAGNPNPSPTTRFGPGNTSGKGRPRGGVAKSALTRRTEEKLDDMLGVAHKNIKTALNKRDVKVSMWLVDRVAKERGTRVEKGLLEPLIEALESIEDVEQISKQCVLLAINGDMSFEQLTAVQEALARHSVLAGVIELRKLREEVDQLAQDQEPTKQLGSGHLPEWGKLKTINPENEGCDDASASG